MPAPDFVFLVLEEHPYGREMLRQLLDAGFVPRALIEERSETAEVEREKFLVRIAGQPVPPSFAELLADHPTERHYVPHHNDDSCRRLLETLAPRLMVLGGTRILKPAVFETATDGCLNAHPGLLPEVRGSASVAWAIHLDLPVGCTCHFIEAGIDTGPIVGRRTIAVHRGDTYERLCAATIVLSGQLMTEAVAAYAEGTLESSRQPEGGPAHRNMPDTMVDEVKAKLARGDYRHLVD